LVSMTFSLTSSLTQPFFGLLGDRVGHSRLMVFGAAIAGLAMSVMLAVDRFWLLLLLVSCSGLASGAFHPQGAALATQTSNERRGSAMSIFMLGGNLGYSFGPLLATTALAIAGAYMSALLALLGVVLAILVAWLARVDGRPLAARPRAQAAAAARAPLALMATVTLVVFLRSWIQTTISTYIPQWFKAGGESTGSAGNLLFIILFPLAIGGLIGGTLSDRIGRRRVLIASTTLIGPSLWLLLHLGGAAPFFVAPVLGLAIGASIPVSIIMTQELVPRGLGLMSGVAMGLQFVSGAIGVWVTGTLADHIGLDTTLSFSVVVPLAAAILAVLLPPDRVPAARVRIVPGAELEELAQER
ncbi:MAG: MFS transporter, partial [Rudaea sp.]